MATDGEDAVAYNGGNNVSIEISELISASIEGKLSKLSPVSSRTHCIYKVHDKLRKVNESAYTPAMVAICPFHHNDERLQAMEEHKLRYMKALLSRSGSLEVKLKACIDSISEVEEEARNCYSEPVKLDRKEFVEIMVVDGLFIIELIRKSNAGLTDGDDPIFTDFGRRENLTSDLILLENQLPMLVLDRLFKISMGNQENHTITGLAVPLFKLFVQITEEKVIEKYKNKEGEHFLDLIGNMLYDGFEKNDEEDFSKEYVIPCATELQEAGVKFLKRDTDGSLLDIKFDKGVLEIPPILIQDSTEMYFRNLIALEQCSIKRHDYMTSYATFMDCLIDSTEDVNILKKSGIIANHLGDDELVSSLFNSLCQHVVYSKFYYSKQCVEINAHIRARWPKWRANLKRKYFQNPWTTISVFAAGLLIALTIVSTTFACLSFFIHKS